MRPALRLTVPSLLLLSLCLLSGGCKARYDVTERGRAPGEVTIIDAPENRRGDTGWFPAVRVGEGDQLHLAWCDAKVGDVKYARRVNGAWRMQLVDTQGAVGKYIHMDLGPDGRPHLVYYHQDQKLLRYAVEGPEGWDIRTVDTGVETGMAARLLVDAKGEPHIAYYTAKGQLRYTTYVTNSKGDRVMRPTVVDREAMGAGTVVISLVQGPDGRFVISYVDWKITDSILKLARQTDEGWTTEIVDDLYAAGWSSAAAFDQNGKLWVAYTEHARYEVIIAHKDAEGVWQKKYLGAKGNRLEMVAGRGGGLYLAFEDTGGKIGKGSLSIAEVKGDQARILSADPTRPVGSYLSIATKSNDELVVAYYDRRYRSLKLYEENPPKVAEAQVREGGAPPSAQDGGF